MDGHGNCWTFLFGTLVFIIESYRIWYFCSLTAMGIFRSPCFLFLRFPTEARPSWSSTWTSTRWPRPGRCQLPRRQAWRRSTSRMRAPVTLGMRHGLHHMMLFVYRGKMWKNCRMYRVLSLSLSFLYNYTILYICRGIHLYVYRSKSDEQIYWLTILIFDHVDHQVSLFVFPSRPWLWIS